MQNVAVIDMGTNTFHLLIAKVMEAKREVLLDEKHAVGLGRGGITNGMIAQDSIDRAMQTLHVFKSLCNKYKVDKVIITGTSAVRSAKNQGEFLKRIKQELDWEVLVLSGEEEAIGIYKGVSLAVTIPEENALIVDIGGGSVEFILCRATEGILWKQSFEIGGQRLMDKFHRTDPIAKKEKEQIEDFLNTTLTSLVQAMQNFKGVKTLIGSSGSFDTLVDMYCAEKEELLPPNTSSYTLPIEAYRKMSRSLSIKTRAERLVVPGMISLRVDMIVVALVLIDWLLDKLNIENIEVSFFALKEGLMREFMDTNATP